jgi:WD40 repeat protein
VTKDGSNARKQAARELAATEKIPYTEALRRLDQRAAAHTPPVGSESATHRRPAASTARIIAPVATLTAHATLLGHTGPVGAVAFHPHGHTLASGGDHTARLWDPATGRTIVTLAQDSGVASVAFNPDGDILAVGNGDGTVLLWTIATGQIATLGQCPDVVRSLAFHPHGHTLATGSGELPRQAFPAHTIHLWNTATATATNLTRPAGEGYGDALAFHPHGDTLAGSGGLDGSVQLWNPASGQSTGLIGHTLGIEAVAFSPDGHTLASGTRDGVVRLWDSATGQATANLLGHTELINSLAYSPDGRTLASASSDKTIRLWTMPSHPRTTP